MGREPFGKLVRPAEPPAPPLPSDTPGTGSLMRSRLASRAPGGRGDADRCRQHRYGLRSEHGECLTQMRQAPSPCPLRLPGGHLAPGPRGSRPARAPHSPARTARGPLVCILDTRTDYCGVPEETCSALFWEGWVTVAPTDGLGRSLSAGAAGFPGACGCGGHHLPAACGRVPARVGCRTPQLTNPARPG